MATSNAEQRGQELSRRTGRHSRHRFRHRDGEFIVLVGPSGCGKSTLLRMVAGLETITSGDIPSAGGRQQARARERDIAMVFQNYALYPHMSVRENMAYGLKNRKCAEGGDRVPRRRGRAHAATRALSRPQAAAALGRPAPARRHGPRHRARAGRLPVRRAAVEPRRQAARADAAARSRRCSASSA
jgi:ABC-type sugar transport system ATPase subunit